MKDRVCRMLRGEFETRWGGATFGFLIGACLLFFCVLLNALLDGGFAGIDWATSATAAAIFGGALALAGSFIGPMDLQTRRDRMIWGFLPVVSVVLIAALMGAVENDDGFAGIDWAPIGGDRGNFWRYSVRLSVYSPTRGTFSRSCGDRMLFGFLVGVGMVFLLALIETIDGSPADIGWGDAVGAGDGRRNIGVHVWRLSPEKFEARATRETTIGVVGPAHACPVASPAPSIAKFVQFSIAISTPITNNDRPRWSCLVSLFRCGTGHVPSCTVSRSTARAMQDRGCSS